MIGFSGTRFGSRGGGGGASIFTPDVAYIQLNGNDSTGVIGDPSKPFLTAQEPFDQGARIFHIGVGVATDVTLIATGSDSVYLHIFVTGCGVTDSIFSVSGEADEGNVDIRVRSNLTVQFGSISGGSANGAACYVEVLGGVVTSFDSQCPNGSATAKAAFSEVGTDLSGILSTSSMFANVGGVSYP